MNKDYDFPLVDWICVALHKKSLAAVIDCVSKNLPVDGYMKSVHDNSRYIEKILREEALKQFSEDDRPLLEVILNGVDARPAEAIDYNLKIKVKSSGFMCSDNGKGMNLDEILRLLIIPFNTDKNGIDEIGRFGVGFLSSFNYCLRNPNKSHVIVDTKTGSEGYRVDFYAKSDKVEDLRMRLRKSKKSPNGTTVKINKKFKYPSHVVGYISSNITGIESHLAKIYLNNGFINDSKYNWHSSPVTLEVNGKIVTQRVAFRRDEKEKLLLTSQGVLIKSFDSYSYGATISFPAAAQPVEGRDEFKIDDNYRRCVSGAFMAFAEYIKEVKATEETSDWNDPNSNNAGVFIRTTEFIPSMMSAFSMYKLDEIPNIEEIKQLLVPDKKYVLSSYYWNVCLPFFENLQRESAFVVGSQGYSYWKEVYSGEDEMVNNLTKSAIILNTADFQKGFEDPNFYPNLKILKQFSGRYDSISLVEFPDGENCCLAFNNNLIINIGHKRLAGNPNSIKSYSVLSDYLHLSPVRVKMDLSNEEDVEKKIDELACELYIPEAKKDAR